MIAICHAKAATGLKIFSDFSLISDFSLTPRTTLEISVKRIFFEWEGVGVLEYSDPNWHWNAPFATSEAKRISGGRASRPSSKRIFDLGFNQQTCYTLSLFLVETHLDP